MGKNVFIFLVAAFFMFFGAGFVAAMIAPQIYFTEGPNLQKNDFKTGETIKGEVGLINHEGGTIGDLSLRCSLLQKKSAANSTVEMAVQAADLQKFSLLADTETKRPFSYVIPAYLPDGDYILRVQLIAGRGEDLSWADKKINIKGAGKFLVIENESLLARNEGVPVENNFYYNIDEAAEAVFDVSNASDSPITAFYKITNYSSKIGGAVVGEKSGDAISLGAGEKKTVKTFLPKASAPGIYLSDIKFYDVATLMPISNPIGLRWIARGEGAKIDFVVFDKNSYVAGDQAQIRVNYVGFADSEGEDIGAGKIEAVILDQSGAEAGKSSKDVELKTGQEIITVPLKIDAANPRITVKIVKSGKTLDTYGYGIFDGEESDPAGGYRAVSGGEPEKSDWKIFLSAAMAIAVLAVLFNVIKKRGKKGAAAAAAVVIFCAAAAAFEVRAAIQVTDSWNDTNMVFNSPLPHQRYQPGDTIRLQGSVKINDACGCLFNNKISFYITEDKDIPYTDCMGRSYASNDLAERCSCNECVACFGSTQQVMRWYNGVDYSPKDCRGNNVFYFTGGNHVKYLDITKGYKIYELKPALINATDFTSCANSDKTIYDKTFTIPADIDLAGPVRFYVVWSGSNTTHSWHWNISYQRGFLRSNPVANADSYAVSRGEMLNVSRVDGVLKNDVDADGENLVAILANDNTANGNLLFFGNGSFTYIPKPGFTGVDSFTYQAFDGSIRSAEVTVTINVTNGSPVAREETYMVTSGQTLNAQSVLQNDTDPNGDALTALLVSGVSVDYGQFNWNGANDGTFTFKSKNGFTGLASFTYRAFDGSHKSSPVTDTIAIVSVNGKPWGLPDFYSAEKNKPLEVGTADGVLKNDTDPNGEALTAPAGKLVRVSGPGVLALKPDGSFIFQSGLDGTSEFTYRAFDGGNYSEPINLVIHTSSSNQPPVAVDDDYEVEKNQTLVVDGGLLKGVLQNDTDPNGDALTAHKLNSDTPHGMLVFNSDGTFIYNSDDGYIGNDSFTYWAKDSNGSDSNVATVEIKVKNASPLMAQMTCDTTGCLGGSCVGSTWIAYRPTSDTPCIFKINNVSAPSSSIIESVWEFEGTAGNNYSKAFYNAGGYGSLQSDISNDNYTVKLTVADGENTASASRNLIVRNDINAGFACSLDGEIWQECNSIMSKGLVGQKVYLRDNSDTLKSHSEPSEGAVITNRKWIFNGAVVIEVDGAPVGDNPEEVYVIQEKGDNKINLEVKDTNNRSDGQLYNLRARRLPDWREVSPVSYIGRLLASIGMFF